MKITIYVIISIILIILFGMKLFSSDSKHNNGDNIIFLENREKKILININSPDSSSRKILTIHKNETIEIFDIKFTMNENSITALRKGKILIFDIPGSYYINILPTTGDWASGKTFKPFEGKVHRRKKHFDN